MARWTVSPSSRVFEALASPVRQDLVVVLENSPPLPVAELARRLGRRPDTLYHHLRALQRAGLAERRAAASTGGRPGSAWRLTTSHLRIDPHAIERGRTTGAERVVGTLARASVRDFGRALRRAVAGKGPHPRAHRSCVWLTPKERRELEASLRRLVGQLRLREPGEGRTPCVLTFVLADVAGPAPGPSRGKGRPRQRAARKA